MLDCLHVATLQPQARHAVIGTRVGGRSGMAIILTAAGGHPFLMDAEVSSPSRCIVGVIGAFSNQAARLQVSQCA